MTSLRDPAEQIVHKTPFWWGGSVSLYVKCFDNPLTSSFCHQNLIMYPQWRYEKIGEPRIDRV